MARIDALVMRGRRAAERLMTDTCIVTRKGAGQGEFNDETGQRDKPARQTIYSGKCRIQIHSVASDGTRSTAGDRTGTVQQSEWQGPVVGTEDIVVNDVIEIVTCAMDSSLVGRQFTVIARNEKSQATKRALPVKEGTS